MSLSMKCVLLPRAFCRSMYVIDHIYADNVHVDDLHSWEPTASFAHQSEDWEDDCPCSICKVFASYQLPMYNVCVAKSCFYL